MTVAILRAHFPQRPPTLNIYAARALDKNTKWQCGCYEQGTFSCVIINMINMLKSLAILINAPKGMVFSSN